MFVGSGHADLAHQWRMSEDAITVYIALAAVRSALATRQLTDPRRQWLEVFHQKFTRMRDRGTVLTPANRARSGRLTGMVEDMLDRHRSALN